MLNLLLQNAMSEFFKFVKKTKGWRSFIASLRCSENEVGANKKTEQAKDLQEIKSSD